MSRFRIRAEDVEFTAVRAQGAGGQNINKVANAAHLRFAIASSTLPAPVQERLRRLAGARLSREGVLVIKAQESRSLEQNRAAALRRLQALVDRAAAAPAARVPTRPGAAAIARRLERKAQRARTKKARAKGAAES